MSTHWGARISIKFRRWGITFGTVARDFSGVLPRPIPVEPHTIISVNDRGIVLLVSLEA